MIMKTGVFFMHQLLGFFILFQRSAYIAIAADIEASAELLQANSNPKSRFNATFVASKDKDLGLFISITSGVDMDICIKQLYLTLIIAMKNFQKEIAELY